MDFGQALYCVKDGKKIQRGGWNGPKQFVVFQPGYPEGVPINQNTAKAIGEPVGTVKKFRPYLILHTAQGDFVQWAPSISDVLADDWEVVE